LFELLDEFLQRRERRHGGDLQEIFADYLTWRNAQDRTADTPVLGHEEPDDLDHPLMVSGRSTTRSAGAHRPG
jgi:hypothetical protein